MKAERYYTAEQLKQLEEQRLNEERRREQEKLDNWRERGLNDMMGGVLQVRREDELKKVCLKKKRSRETCNARTLCVVRKFRSHSSSWKKKKKNGTMLRNKSINNIYKKSKNNKKNETNYGNF